MPSHNSLSRKRERTGWDWTTTQGHYMIFTQYTNAHWSRALNINFQNGGGDGSCEEKTRIKRTARRKRLAKNNSIVSYCIDTCVELMLFCFWWMMPVANCINCTCALAQWHYATCSMIKIKTFVLLVAYYYLYNSSLFYVIKAFVNKCQVCRVSNQVERRKFQANFVYFPYQKF